MSRCKANPCCGNPHSCEVPLPQHKSGLVHLNAQAEPASAAEPVETDGPEGRPELTDDRLRELIEYYTAETVPPCRVCGHQLAIQSAGGGEVVWGCNNIRTDTGTDWGHYDSSRHRQWRLGDPDVVRALTELLAFRNPGSTSGARKHCEKVDDAQ